MSEWHLRELEAALVRHGWRVDMVLRGERTGVSATWAIVRGASVVHLDFDGLDDLETLPIERAYACPVREHSAIGLYFSRRRTEVRRKRS